MKKIKYIITFLGLFFMTDRGAIARLNDICGHTNESVVKFRKKIFNGNLSKAREYCVDKDLIGSGVVYFDWPIDLCDFWISSLFGPRTYKGKIKQHTGIDMAAYAGTDVKSAAPGKVMKVQENVPGYGTVIEILHKGGMVTRYAHLQDTMVVEKQKVDRGEIVGIVGATGNVRGTKDPSHLHFEIINAEHKQVNPLDYLYCAEVAFVNNEE